VSPIQALGYRSKCSNERSIMRFAARISAWRIAVVASTSTMIGYQHRSGKLANRRKKAGPRCAVAPCCRIGWRDELRRHFACRAECGIVEDGEILLDRTAGRIGGRPRAPSTRLRCGVGLDQAGIDGKASPPTSPSVDAALQHCLEQTSQKVTIAKAAWRFFENVEWSGTEPSSPSRPKPAVREVQVNLFA